MRILALDVGTRRIGVAVSDPLGITARPHATLQRDKQSVERILSLVRELEVCRIVVGLPLHLDGHEGKQAKDVRSFAQQLEPHSSVPIEFWDERLSTVEAEERLAGRGDNRRKNKIRIDSFAAATILESYLNERK